PSPRTAPRRRGSCRAGAPSVLLPDRRSKQLAVAERVAALLAVDGERRADRRCTRGAAAQHPPATLRTLLGNLVLELLEPPPRGAAAEAERDPVAEHLPALLAQPLRRLSHHRFWSVSSPIASAIASRRSRRRSWSPDRSRT